MFLTQCAHQPHYLPMKCLNCGSEQFQKNGHRGGKQNYRCKNCGRQHIEAYTARGYSDDTRQICIKMHRAGLKLREIERLTGVSHGAVHNWVKQAGLLLDSAESEEGSVD